MLLAEHDLGTFQGAMGVAARFYNTFPIPLPLQVRHPLAIVLSLQVTLERLSLLSALRWIAVGMLRWVAVCCGWRLDFCPITKFSGAKLML